MMICEGKEKLRAFEERNGISKAIIHLERQGWWEALGGGGGGGRATKKGLFQEPQDRKGTEKIPWLRNRV